METVKYPFVAIFPPFLGGILFASKFNINIPYLPFILLALLIFATFAEKKIFENKNIAFGYFIFPFLFFLGCFVADFHKAKIPAVNSDEPGFYEGIIIEQPELKDNSVQTILEIHSVKDSNSWQNLNTKAVVYIQKDSAAKILKYGDKIIFKGYLNEIKNSGNPKEFNYKDFMANKGIFYTSYAKKDEFCIIEHNRGNFLKGFALKTRAKLLDIYSDFKISGRKYGVLSALTLGYRDAVDNKTRQMFANTGAMHILAVSGLHVGIIFMILNSLLAFMNRKRILLVLKSLIIIASLWLFAFIAGLTPSVTRSALMFSLFVVGRMLMRSTSIYNIIFASAFILLLINPLEIYSVGFQLSYAAVLSIVFFQPYIYQMFVFEKFLPDKIWALLSVSIAAQMGTMPIGFYYFHQFPNYFFLTNVLVIPMASIILYLAVILLAIHWIPLISGAFAFLLKLSLKFLLLGIGAINSLPYSTTKDIFITGTQTFVLYAVILTFALFWIYNRKQLLYAFLVSLLFFLILNIKLKYENLTTHELIVFNTRKSFTMNILNSSNTVIADNAVFGKSDFLKYSCKPYWISKKVEKPKKYNIDSLQLKNNTLTNNFFVSNSFMKIGNSRIMVVRDNEIFDKVSSNSINVDYVVLTKNVYLDISDVLKLVNFDVVIFDSSNKYYRTEKWTKQCKKLDVKYHDVINQGAFAVDYITKERIDF